MDASTFAAERARLRSFCLPDRRALITVRDPSTEFSLVSGDPRRNRVVVFAKALLFSLLVDPNRMVDPNDEASLGGADGVALLLGPSTETLIGSTLDGAADAKVFVIDARPAQWISGHFGLIDPAHWNMREESASWEQALQKRGRLGALLTHVSTTLPHEIYSPGPLLIRRDGKRFDVASVFRPFVGHPSIQAMWRAYNYPTAGEA